MDARLVLGLEGGNAAGTPTAGAVRSAHRRLARRVHPERGGSSGLAALVDTAAAALASGTTSIEPPCTPAALLGVSESAGEDEVRAGYRRLARLTHPDLGGTDELFRAVAAATDALLHRGVGWADALAGRRRSTRGASTWGPRWAAPPPRPPRPYRPPPPSGRPMPNRRGAWIDIASVGAWAILAATVGLGLWRLPPGPGRVVLVLLLGVALVPGRFLVGQARRSAIVLLGRRVRIDAAVDPEAFLVDRCLDAPVGREEEHRLYAAYDLWCRRRRVEPVSPFMFIETLRGLGLLYVKSSAWQPGIWVGIRLAPAAPRG